MSSAYPKTMSKTITMHGLTLIAFTVVKELILPTIIGKCNIGKNSG